MIQFIIGLHHSVTSETFSTMGKSKCYQSPSSARPPKCNKVPSGLCLSCQDAMATYNQLRVAKLAERRQKNRNSARLSRMKKEDKFSDLLADNIALEMEYEGLTNELDSINTAISAIKEEVSVKVQEILAIAFDKNT